MSSGPHHYVVHIEAWRIVTALADCFKYRNKIGLDTCLESLQMYKQQRSYNVEAILKFAAVCRVAGVMRPYIEAIL